MVRGGLWHGAHWNFVIWGALHGFYLIINQLTRSLCTRLGILKTIETHNGVRLTSWALTFLGTVMAWVFFRATTTSGAFSMLGSMFGLSGDGVDIPASTETMLLILIAALIAFLLPNTKQLSEWVNRLDWRKGAASPLALGAYTGVAGAGAFFASLSIAQSPFLYFNF